MSEDNHDSPIYLKKFDCVTVPDTSDSDDMASPGSPPTSGIFIPPPDYDLDASATSENISFHADSSYGYSSEYFLPHSSFSRSRVREESRKTCEGTSDGYSNSIYHLSNDYREEFSRPNKSIAKKNNFFREIAPLVHPASNSSAASNTFLKDGKLHTATASAGNSSTFSHPINDSHCLDDSCGLPKSQPNSCGEEKYSSGDLRCQLEKDNEQIELIPVPSRGFHIDSKTITVIKNQRNVNEDSKLLSSRTQKKQTSFVSRYPEADAANRMKNGENICESSPSKEFNSNSQCRWKTFKLPLRNPRLLPTAKAAQSFYHNLHSSQTFRRIPGPARDDFPVNQKKLNQLNSQSSSQQNVPAVNSGAPSPGLMNGRTSNSPENFYSNVLSSFRKHPKHIHMQDKIPGVHLSVKQPRPYQITYLKNKDKVAMQRDNDNSTGHSSDQESIFGSSIYEYDEVFDSQIENCSAMNMTPHIYHGASCPEQRLDYPIETEDDKSVSYYSITDGCSLYGHLGSPVIERNNIYDSDKVFNYQVVESCEATNPAYHLYRNSSLPEEKPGSTAQTKDDNSVSYYSVPDGDSLYARLESPVVERSLDDMDCSLLNSRNHTEQKCRENFGGVINLGYTPELHQLKEVNENNAIDSSNLQASGRYTLDANPYYANVPLKNTKVAETKRRQFSSGSCKASCSSSYDENIPGQLKNNSKVIRESEAIYSYDVSRGDSNMIQVSVNIPSRTDDPRIILCPSELPVPEDGENLTERMYNIPSFDLEGRCFRWKCKAEQLIVWLAVVIFFLAMVVYISHQYPALESPLLLIFLIPLVLSVFFGFARGCRMC